MWSDSLELSILKIDVALLNQIIISQKIRHNANIVIQIKKTVIKLEIKECDSSLLT